MCYSAEDGGQRCASHTRTLYHRAKQRLADAPRHGDSAPYEIEAANKELDSASVAYASTTEGHDVIAADRDAAAAAQMWSKEAYLNDVLRRGENLRAVNAELRDALRRAPRTLGDRIKRRPARLRTNEEIEQATLIVHKFGWENAPNGVLID